MNKFPGIFMSESIFNNEMTSAVARVNTFKMWMHKHIQDPDALVKCGFYYTGENDKVICFHCGIGLHNWEPNDSPWIEHAINSPLCPFLLLNKHQSLKKSDDEPFKRLIVSYLFIWKYVFKFTFYRIIIKS